MKDAGHRDAVESALRFERTDRIPVNNFALATAARSAGVMLKDARYDPGVSARVSVDYALRTGSDFVKPILDSQIPFVDLGMKVDMPDDDYGTVRGTLVDDLSEMDGIEFFDPSDPSQCPNFDRCFTQSLRRTAEILPEDLHVCGLAWGPITTAGYVMGTENLIIGYMMGDGDAIGKLILKCADFVSDQIGTMIDSGATLMWMADPTSSEDIISPSMFPMSIAGIDRATHSVKKSHSDVPAFLHICGNTLDLIPCLRDTGTDCFSFDHAVDPAKARMKAGRRLALMGNIDPVRYIMSGTPDSIKDECRRIIDLCGREGGFVLAPGCETPISSPDANIIAMGEAGASYWGEGN